MSNISVTTTQNVIEVTQTSGITVTTPEGQTINVEVPNSSVNVTNTTDDITITEVGITNTDQLIEGTTNLFFTNARARAAISLTTDDTSILDYNSTTGVFTWDTPTTTKIAEGTNQYFTQARARQSLSAGTGISYDNSTGVITNTSINTDTTYTIDAATATGGANLTLTGSDSSTDSVKFAGGTNITVSRTDANTITIDGTDTNTTYTQNASSTTGGANLNLVGSDSSTDTIKFASGTNITVSRTDANTITIDGSDLNTTYTIASASTSGGANLTLTGSDSSTDSVAYLGAGATTVTSTDANTVTITSTDTNTTYTQNASSTSGGANLNLVGSDSTTDSIKLASGTNVTVTRTDADTVTISSTDTNTTYTVDATSTSGGANLNLTGSDSSTDSVAYLGSGATTITRTDANTITVSSTDTNTTYTQNISSTTGGANLNLVGSDSTTDMVKFANGTGVTVAYTDADTATISIGQDVATTANPTFAGGTFGNVTVGVDTDQTISTSTGNLVLQTATGTNAGTMTLTAGANGNITLSPNGTGIVMANAGVQSTRSFAAGNAAIGSSGEIGTVATFDATGATSGATMQLGVRSENVTAGFAVTNGIVDHGQNRSGGGPTTSGNPSMYLESTRGTAAAPTATGSGDNIGALSFGGHDGVRGLGSQTNGGSVQLIGIAGQAFLNNGTYTTQAGATTILRSQPSNLRLTSASRQNILLASYTGGTTNTPPTQNLLFNSSSMTTQYDAAGNSINGHGRQDVLWYHPTHSIFGVPSQSTANADNSTLPGSNVLTFFTSRQSGWSGRRDIVEANDTLAQIRVFGQTTNNSTGNGSQTGTIEFKAAETFSTTRRGSVFTLQTGQIGTNDLNTRLSLDSDNATFSTTRTRFATTGVSKYGGEISMKTGIIDGATSYDKTTELSVTALTADGTNNATYETKTLRSTDGVNYTPTQSGDVLGRFTFLGNYATATAPLVSNAAGNISVRASENFTSGASGAAMQFNVNKIGTNTNISVLDLAPAASTFRSDAFTFQDSNNVDITGNLIDYNRVYGQWEQDGPVTPVAATTSYVFPIGTAIDTNIASVGSTSRIIPGAAGKYNLQFSLQWANADNQEHTFYVWLRKNGVNVTNSTGDVTCLKSARGVTGWNYIVSSANATDYWELAYQVTNTNVTFPYVAAQGTAPNDIPSAPALITTLTPVGA